MLTLNEDRLFPVDPEVRERARTLYARVRDLPIVSPHGHTDPQWFADNLPFANPADLLIVPDHYVLRMLLSQGVHLEDLGVPTRDGSAIETDPREVWRRFAENYHVFRGTPSRCWLDYTFAKVFGLTERPNAKNADATYDYLDACLKTPQFLPRALFERFNIEVIATTESPLDPLPHHDKIRASGWNGRVVTAYRPDSVVDPEFEGFAGNVAEFGRITGENTATWDGYLNAHRNRRAYFATRGATSTDHGHPSALTADFSKTECEALLAKALAGKASAQEAELFRAQMLTEMAKMSLADGLVMQIHAGPFRNHSAAAFAKFGRDKGFDIPTRTDYVRALKPLLDRCGLEPNLTIILFTLDETSYSRELAPLAGAYPALKLGPPWWFFDAPEGMKRFRELTTETAGFYNTVGFNDDTRAFMSIPARHDVARRIDCSYLAQLVSDHRLEPEEAEQLAVDLAYNLAKKAYKL